MRDKAVMMSSTTPSVKYSCSMSPLRFRNGSAGPKVLPGRSQPPRARAQCCSGRLFAMSDEDFVHRIEHAHPKLFWHWGEPRRCI
jgi:hypothetical protein